MKPESTSDTGPLVFSESDQEPKTVKARSTKVGWVRAVESTPDLKYDLVFRDARGIERLRRSWGGNQSGESGELFNLPVMLGEELKVSVENMNGRGKIELFVN